MGKLIKNHLARLLTLTSGAYHILASIEGFFWPKVLWDWSTKLLDPAVKPIPILQIINLLIGLTVLAWEWPLGAIAGSLWHRSIEARLFFLPLASLAAVLLYQGTNAAIYYLVCEVVWFVAFADGEEVAEKPWSLPKKTGSSKREKA